MKDSDRLGGQFTPMRASMRARFPIPHEAQHRSREERTDRTAQEPGEGEVILPPELGALGVERCEGQLAAALDESDVGHTRPTLVLPGRDLHHVGQRERADPGVALETSAGTFATLGQEADRGGIPHPVDVRVDVANVGPHLGQLLIATAVSDACAGRSRR